MLEILIYCKPFWRFRQAEATLLCISLAGTAGGLILQHFTWWTALLAIISLYRIINLGRLAENRMQSDYLLRAARRTSLWLIGWQGALVLLAILNHQVSMPATAWWYSLAGLQLLAATVLLASTIRHLRTTLPPPLTDEITERDLPSLTVAIPARNETAELEACLQSLVASTYPKLEILVLDDCSQNQRTPEIIRSFAHDGVRFIAGVVPPDKWLAKNYAYEQLTQTANGELLLFCGVDTRFEPGSLTALVSIMLQKRKSMLSILPRNTAPEAWQLHALLIQPARYAWELVLPRRWLQRPPVLSTCWLITKTALQAAGGFAAVSRTGVPESYLARVAAGRQDGYSFLQSDSTISISSQKTLDEQQATAGRTRYPQLHRRPELVALVGLAECAVFIGPLLLLIVALLVKIWILAALSALAYLMVATVYSRVVNLTYRRFLLRGTWLLPLAAAYDIWLLHYSMWQYEFREVIWKGRNVCIPMMRVVARLPRA